MANEKPDFKAFEGVAVWEKTDKNGNKYLSISIALLGKTFRAFPPKVDEVVA